jgi:hypothetical protein
MAMAFGNVIPGWGVDLRPENRPGVPQELAPHPMGTPPYATPEQQHNGRPTALDALRPVTPVYGTVVPKRGLSGLIRTAAYKVPSHLPRRWMMLMMADRIDVIEHNFVPLATVLGGAAVAVTGLVLAIRASSR